MANLKLPVSAELFNKFSFAHLQLQLIMHIMGVMTHRAMVQEHELDADQLLLILEQLDALVARGQKILDDVKKALDLE